MSFRYPEHVTIETVGDARFNLSQFIQRLRENAGIRETTIAPEELVDRYLEEILRDIANHNRKDQLVYALRLSTQGTHELFEEKNAQPYQASTPVPSETHILKELFTHIGSYLSQKYQLEKSSGGVSEKTRGALAQFLRETTYSLYGRALEDLNDEVRGIHPNWRDTGEVLPAEESRAVITRASAEYLQERAFSQKSAAPNQSEIDGLAQRTFDYLNNGRLHLVDAAISGSAAPEDIFGVVRRISQDHFGRREFAERKLHITAEYLQFCNQFELDTEKFLEIFQYKESAEVVSVLTAFLTHPTLVSSLQRELQDHFPTNSALSYQEMLHIIAPRLGYTAQIYDPAAYVATRRAKWQSVAKNENDRFPLIFNADVVDVEFKNPGTYGIIPRQIAYTFSNKNRDGYPFTRVAMGRLDGDLTEAEAIFHDGAHAAHYTLMHLAARHGDCAQSDIDTMPSSLLEEFAILVEGVAAPHKTGAPTSEFSKLFVAFGDRFQAQVGILQIEIRKKIENLVKKKGASNIDYPALIEELYEEVARVRNLGVPIQYAKTFISTIFDILRPDEGLLYMPAILERNNLNLDSVQEKQPSFGIREAMLKSFEENWYLNQDARIVLCYVMALSGNPDNRPRLKSVILAKRVDIAKAKLTELGVDVNAL